MVIFQPFNDGEQTLCLLFLDTAVREVFERMLNLSCTPSVPAPAAGEQMQVKVAVSGELEGSCRLLFSLDAARAAAAAFAGWEGDGMSLEDVSDAAGEIGNMVVGSLRGKLGFAVASSKMSVPEISMAETEPMAAKEPELTRTFRFEENWLEVRLALLRVERTSLQLAPAF